MQATYLTQQHISLNAALNNFLYHIEESTHNHNYLWMYCYVFSNEQNYFDENLWFYSVKFKSVFKLCTVVQMNLIPAEEA